MSGLFDDDNVQAVGTHTVLVNATELKDANPLFISVVDRGANRRPFQVVKSEEGAMPIINAQTGLDLVQYIGDMRQKKSEQVAAPSLKGLIVPEGTAEGMRAAIEAAGLPAILSIKSEGGADFILFDETRTENDVVYSIDDNHAMICSGVVENAKKYVSTWPSSEDFMTNIATSGLYSDIWTALSTADSTIYQILDQASDPAETATKVEAVLADLSTHVLGIISAIPVTAYKAEKILSAVVKEIKAKAEAQAVETAAAVVATIDEQVADPMVDATVVDGTTEPVAAPAPAPIDVSALAAAVVEMITPTIQGVVKSELSATTSAVKEQAEQVQTLVAKAEQSLQNVLVQPPVDNPDAELASPVVKNDSGKSSLGRYDDSGRALWEQA